VHYICSTLKDIIAKSRRAGVGLHANGRLNQPVNIQRAESSRGREEADDLAHAPVLRLLTSAAASAKAPVSSELQASLNGQSTNGQAGNGETPSRQIAVSQPLQSGASPQQGASPRPLATQAKCLYDILLSCC